MKRDILEKELLKVLDDAEKLKTTCEMELSTAEFLRKEANKLMENAYKAPFDEKEDILNKLNALYGRIQHEIRSWEAGEEKLVVLDKRMNKLKLIVGNGSYE